MDQSLRPVPLGNEKAGLIPGAVPISRRYQLPKLRRANNREGRIETGRGKTHRPEHDRMRAAFGTIAEDIHSSSASPEWLDPR
jgi:hypothetical protein